MTRYHHHHYKLPPEFLKRITDLRTERTLFSLALIWVEIVGLVFLARYLIGEDQFWSWYVLLGFLIAGRQGALLQLVHESSHHLISRSPRWNLAIPRWFCALPLGVMIEGYIEGHRMHHSWTGTSNDPPADVEKYRVVDFRDPKLYFLFLKDLLGITAVGIFLTYNEGEQRNHSHKLREKLIPLICLCLVQLFLLIALFQTDVLAYLFLWLVPAACFHMFLMRIRGIAEHGLSRQLNVAVENVYQGTYFTRSFLAPGRTYRFLPLYWIEKILIGSLSVHYHHEHHLFPHVPFYHLAALHREIAKEVYQANPDAYAKGYFSAAMRTITQPIPKAPPLQSNEVPA